MDAYRAMWYGSGISGAIISSLHFLLEVHWALSILAGTVVGWLFARKVSDASLLREGSGILSWGVIFFSLLTMALKWIGVITSPPVTEMLLVILVNEFTGVKRSIAENGRILSDHSANLQILWEGFRELKQSVSDHSAKLDVLWKSSR